MKLQLPLLAIAVISITSCGPTIEETQPFRKDIVETVFTSGELVAEGAYNLTAKSDGYLLEVNFEEGDLVKKGQRLALIQNETPRLNTSSSKALFDISKANAAPSGPALAQAQTSIDIARKQVEQDSVQAERYHRLWQQNSIAKIDFETKQLALSTSKSNLESAIEAYQKIRSDAEQQVINSSNNYRLNLELLKDIEIFAIQKGKVYQKHKSTGDYVRKGDVIATLADAESIYAEVFIDENSIAKIQEQQRAVIQLNTNPDKQYQAVVETILPAFDEVNQSFTCHLQFTDPLDFKIIGTQLEANIIVDSTKNALLIPREFMDYSGYVSIKGQAEKVKVESQTISKQYVHVLSGISDTVTLTVQLN
ncbi:MAG: HlyD family efflux transporter periplasmic adaptor subunit [Bacteroidota bacterium]